MNFFTIPATESFSYRLAQLCEEMAAEKQIPLSSFKIFLPTRRGIRTLQDAFLNLSKGKPRLLPIMQSIGDADLEEANFGTMNVEEIPPAIDPMRRQLVLARLLEKAWPHDYNYQQALHIAAELGRLIDQIHTQNIDPTDLASLKDVQEYAEHWEITTSFLLLILNTVWPDYLNSQGTIDPGLHRRKRITLLTDYYKNHNPEYPVIVAGSTGSIPATRDFIKTIGTLNNGIVVLPALDTQADKRSWIDVKESHPQYLLKILLSYCKIEREEVISICPSTNPDRLNLASEMMRPAETTHEWQSLSLQTETILDGVQGITLCEAESDHQEATTIALAMLEIAADPNKEKTATLITPDRYLAMRVQSLLRQWGVDIDDSGGTSLTNTALGQYCIACLQTYQNGQIYPLPFLSCAKNPYAGGADIPNYRNTIRSLEKAVFRGVRPYGDFATFAVQQEKHHDAFETLHSIFSPFAPYQKGSHPLREIIAAHLTIMENLSALPDTSGAERLWKGDDGEALAQFFSTLQLHAGETPLMTLANYTEMITGLLSSQTFTASFGKHPRLSILGQIEARMVQADRVILSGLNEGIWPPDSGFDIWMSRKMRADFGLPSLEQKTSLTAHDFMTAFCAEEVFITRSKKSGGQPTLPSRWLNRLNTVLHAANIAESDRPQTRGHIYTNWASQLTQTESYAPCSRPAPTPPLAHRPDQFSVTEIEKWMRDPYWIYAKKILGLRTLDPVDMEVGAADRGTLIHKTMERFTKQFSRQNLPDHALASLLDIGKDVFDTQAQSPEIHGFWWPRFTRAARWFIAHEEDWRVQTSVIHTEATGYLSPVIEGHTYNLKGKADRIESRADGGYALIDYKTGAAPDAKDVNSGLASQLALEALMLNTHGFENIPYRDNTEISLYYWSLSGSGDGGEAKTAQGPRGKPSKQLIEEAKDGFYSLLFAFHNNNTPYLGSPDPSRKIKTEYNEYAHLERISEWSVNGDEGDAA